jgi:hypothetical protein
MTDGDRDDSRLLIAATHGPAWSGHAPYPEPDYVGARSDLAAPTIECQSGTEPVSNPSWSRDGDLLAYGTADGVHVMSIPEGLDCARIGRVSLRPRTIRAGGATRVSFTLSAPARVTVRAGGRRVRAHGRRGVNSVRFGGRGVRPGAYRLRVSAGGSVAAARLTIRR